MRHDQVEAIAKRLGVTKQDVINMNRWLSGDVSLNSPIREDSDSGEWQDYLVEEGASQETTLAASDELDNRRKTLASALSVLNDRERRIFEARRLAEDPATLADLASEFGVSRERVRQIDVNSFWKVQKMVKSHVATIETPAPLGTRAVRPPIRPPKISPIDKIVKKKGKYRSLVSKKGAHARRADYSGRSRTRVD
jgi:RNA polymerase sigma-32 factor